MGLLVVHIQPVHSLDRRKNLAQNTVKLPYSSSSSLFYIGLLVLLLTMAFQMPTFLSRSLPLQPDALAAMQFPPNSQRAIFAGGCFWGLEELYRKHLGNGKGLLDCRVGYTGGQTKAPSYE